MILLFPALLFGSVPWSHRAVLAGALVFPIPTALGIGLFLLRHRRPSGRPVIGPEATALLEVLAALQAGRTLRTALAGMSDEIDRLVTVGASTEALASAVERALPDQGQVAAAAVRLLDHAGGPASPVVSELAAQATETARVRRELRAAVAAPVLQGVIVGGAPLAALSLMIVTGSFGQTFARSPAHAITVSAGAAMTVVGVVWVLAIVRRSMP
jgi:Flp pilus assembly protein TadB